MKKNKEVLLSKDDIANRVRELGQKITEDYKDKNLLAVSLLKGSFVFAADLLREIKLPVRIEFMVTSSYLHGEKSTGDVSITYDLDLDMKDYDILIIDDIIDSGHTMKSVYESLLSKNPKSVSTVTLLDKPSRRQVDFEVDYKGFVIEDKFIVGYGLNYGDYYRNVDHIFAFVEADDEN